MDFPELYGNLSCTYEFRVCIRNVSMPLIKVNTRSFRYIVRNNNILKLNFPLSRLILHRSYYISTTLIEKNHIQNLNTSTKCPHDPTHTPLPKKKKETRTERSARKIRSERGISRSQHSGADSLSFYVHRLR